RSHGQGIEEEEEIFRIELFAAEPLGSSWTSNRVSSRVGTPAKADTEAIRLDDEVEVVAPWGGRSSKMEAACRIGLTLESALVHPLEEDPDAGHRIPRRIADYAADEDPAVTGDEEKRGEEDQAPTHECPRQVDVAAPSPELGVVPPRPGGLFSPAPWRES